MKYSKRCEFVIPSLEFKPDEKLLQFHLDIEIINKEQLYIYSILAVQLQELK